MVTKESPIGVIDSGIGGFSVARTVQRMLPEEDLLYLGDGAHVPYGNLSQDRILTLTRYMLGFMRERQVKAVLIACNTISCIIDQCAGEMSCPTISAVQAGADAVCGLDAERVGIISTVFTCESHCYPDRIRAQSTKERRIFSRGCPDLARLIEHNLGDPNGMVQVEENLRQELDPLVNRDKIQCCVLACTHYPLVADSIHKLYPGLTLVDPAEQMGRELEEYLKREGLRREAGRAGRMDIYTTGDVEEYRFRARQVGLNPVSSVSYYPPMD